jgi:phosphohistidine phosphatase
VKVCVLRHGPAVPRGTPGLEDDARPLTPEGRARTREAARGIRKLKLGIDAIWTSPLPRARETAEILARELRLPAPKTAEALRPETPPARIARFLRGLRAACPALVGHEPDLGATVALLTGGRSDAFPLKKAGLALLDLPRKGAGALQLFLTPSALRALGAR